MTTDDMVTAGQPILDVKEAQYYEFKVIKDAMRAATTLVEMNQARADLDELIG